MPGTGAGGGDPAAIAPAAFASDDVDGADDTPTPSACATVANAKSGRMEK
jgi:hypothetical protein